MNQHLLKLSLFQFSFAHIEISLLLSCVVYNNMCLDLFALMFKIPDY